MLAYNELIELREKLANGEVALLLINSGIQNDLNPKVKPTKKQR